MEQHPLKGLRVLIVEDEELIGFMLSEMIVGLGGVPVGPYEDLKSALAAGETGLFEMALLDVNLRYQASFAVADILVERGIPFAFMSGFGTADFPPHLAGARYMAKPCRVAPLTEMLTSMKAYI